MQFQVSLRSPVAIALAIGSCLISVAGAQTPAPVPAALTCPGGLPPDMPLTALTSFPNEVNAWLGQQDEDFREDYLCGRYLQQMLEGNTYHAIQSGYATPAARQAALADLRLLLSAGQVPRERDGQADWVRAAASLLSQNQPQGEVLRPMPPKAHPRLLIRQARQLDDEALRSGFHEVFVTHLLPKLKAPGPDDEFGMAIVVRGILRLPQDRALDALQRLKSAGTLAFLSSPSTSATAVESVRNGMLTPLVTEEVFKMLAPWVRGTPKSNQELLMFAIKAWSPTGTRRALAMGADPTTAEVMALVNEAQLPQIHALLKQAAERRGAAIAPYVSQAMLKPGTESAYTCQPGIVPGQASEGEGSHGCYFILRDPTTGRPLPKTRYRLAVSEKSGDGWPKQDRFVNDVTDAEGRSVYLWTSLDTEMRATHFVQVIGAGPVEASYKHPIQANGTALVPRRYELSNCRGKVVHRGHLDPMGNTVLLQSKDDKCATRIKLQPGE